MKNRNLILLIIGIGVLLIAGVIWIQSTASHPLNSGPAANTPVAPTSTPPITSPQMPMPTSTPAVPPTPKPPAPVIKTAAPHITNLFPMATTTGATVTLTGTGFTPTGNNVNFSVYRAASNISSTNNGTTLTFTVPAYGTAECAANAACPTWAVVLAPGNAYMLTVQNANGTSNALTFTVK